MKKYVEISEEAIARLLTGKCVEGSLHRVKGRLVFSHYNRQPRVKQKDRLVRELEHGWLKESPKRLKFFNSVKKTLGSRLCYVAMQRELKEAMTAVETQEMIEFC